jgi:hypothetical protein
MTFGTRPNGISEVGFWRTTAVVLLGDLVLAEPEGVLFIPAILAEDAISAAEFTALTDEYNFELITKAKTVRSLKADGRRQNTTLRKIDRCAPAEAEDVAQRTRRAVSQGEAAE